jgi:hypothetical protein
VLYNHPGLTASDQYHPVLLQILICVNLLLQFALSRMHFTTHMRQT